MANVTVTIRVEDDQAIPQPVDGVLVRIFNAAGDTFITEGLTGWAPGEAVFTLFGDTPGVDYTLYLSKDGYSFPPTPSKIISVTDPPSPPNTFTFTAHEGLDDMKVEFSVQDNQLVPEPVEDVRIRIFDISDTYLTEVVTDSAGEADIYLPGAASPGTGYIVRLTPPAGYLIQNGSTQTISVLDPVAPPDTNVFDFVAEPFPEVPTSPDPDMCRLSGYFTDPSKRPLKNHSLIFHPREGYPSTYPMGGAPYSGEPSVVGGRIVASDRRVNADSDGYVSFDLPRGGVFDVYLQGMDAPDISLLAEIYVPDVAGIEIEKVLYPYLETATFGEAAIAVAAGDTVTVSISLLTSNLMPADRLDPACLLGLELDDESVASIEINDDGELEVTGLAAGVANLTVTRLEGTIPPYSPVLADLAVFPSSPVITVT